METKMVPTSQKISGSLVRVSSFLDSLLQIPIMVSTSSKIAPTEKNIFSAKQKIRFH